MVSSKQLKHITQEVLDIQNDTSNWLSHINDPRNKDFDLSTSLLLARCYDIINKIDVLVNTTIDSTILAILLQNRTIAENTKTIIENIQTTIHVERQSIMISDKTVDVADLINFKNKLINDRNRHGEFKDEEV